MEWDQRVAEVHRQASELFQQRPHWATFVQHVWNIVIPDLFPTAEERRRLERTEQFAAIAQWRDELRRTGDTRPKETLSTLTIRVPGPLHTALTRESWDYRLSLNELCVVKLLNPLPPN